MNYITMVLVNYVFLSSYLSKIDRNFLRMNGKLKFLDRLVGIAPRLRSIYQT